MLHISQSSHGRAEEGWEEVRLLRKGELRRGAEDLEERRGRSMALCGELDRT